jgi:hypothetical protein
MRRDLQEPDHTVTNRRFLLDPWSGEVLYGVRKAIAAVRDSLRPGPSAKAGST